MIGFSTIGASLSTEQLVGVVGFAYTHGMAVANWEWLNFVGYSLLIWVFLPIYARNRIVTMPEFLELRYGPAVRKMYAVISVLSYVFINLARIFEVEMNAFNIAGVVFVLSLLFMVLVSRWTEAADPTKIAGVLWK